MKYFVADERAKLSTLPCPFQNQAALLVLRDFKDNMFFAYLVAPTRPVIKLKPSRTEITILERKTRLVRIVCKHIGGQPKPAFQWINPKGKIVHECDKYTSRCTLFIRHPVYEKDHGTYTCLASSSGGTSNQSVFLNIQGKRWNKF